MEEAHNETDYFLIPNDLTPTDAAHIACRILAISALFLAVSSIPRFPSMYERMKGPFAQLADPGGWRPSTLISFLLFGIATLVFYRKSKWIATRMLPQHSPATLCQMTPRAAMLRLVNECAGAFIVLKVLPSALQDAALYGPLLCNPASAGSLMVSDFGELASVCLATAIGIALLRSVRRRKYMPQESGTSHV